MKDMQLTINYECFGSVEELGREDEELLTAARDAAEGAYAPYSHFKVGAAVRTSGGHIVIGSNQENAAYPSGLCAERVAIFAAGANFPEEDVVGIAVYGGTVPQTEKNGTAVPPISPCGACREVIAECSRRSGKPVNILLAGPDAFRNGKSSNIYKFDSINYLLPFSFDLEKNRR